MYIYIHMYIKHLCLMHGNICTHALYLPVVCLYATDIVAQYTYVEKSYLCFGA